MFKPVFYRAFQGVFSRYGKTLPAVADKLLALIKGAASTDGYYRKDFYKAEDHGYYPVSIYDSPCCTFNGIADEVEFHFSRAVTSVGVPFTMGCKFVVNALTGVYQCILDRETRIDSIYIHSDGTLRVAIGFGSRTFMTVVPGAVYDVRVVSNGVTFDTYINGIRNPDSSWVEDGVSPGNVGTNDKSGSEFDAGMAGEDHVYPFAGKIWDVELAGRTYPFQEGVGTVVYDTSGNGDNAEVVTTDIAAFWAGKQDSTHTTVTDGFSTGLENQLKNSEDLTAATFGGGDYVVLGPDEVWLTTVNGYFRTTSNTVLASTNYEFSFYCEPVDAVDLNYRVYDVTNGAEITAGSYNSQVEIGSLKKVVVPFTTPVGCTSVYVYFAYNSTQTSYRTFIRKAQLRKASSPDKYIKTTTNIADPTLLLPVCKDGYDAMGNSPTNPKGYWNDAPVSYGIAMWPVASFYPAESSVITATTEEVLSGDFTISFRAYFSPGVTGVVCGSKSTTSSGLVYDQDTGNFRVRIDSINYQFATHPNTTRFITVSRVGSDLTVTSEVGTQTISSVSTADFTIGKIGAYSDLNYGGFNGYIGELKINEKYIPLWEGAGTDIYEYSGGVWGTVTTSNLSTFWGSSRVPKAIAEADWSWNFFTNAGTEVQKIFTQGSMDFSVTGKDQYFFGNCYGKGLYIYDQVLVGQDLLDAKVATTCI